MKILITGAKGQLGNSLKEVLTTDQLFLTDLPELNLASYHDTKEFVEDIKPEVVIHCAAKTQVDDCELKPEEAYLANVIATKNVVNACQTVNATLVYVSTDYVFDGTGTRPYNEYDRCNPHSVYGMTKWQGEEIVKTHLTKFFITRTAWLFGDMGNNIVRTILKLAKERDVLKFVNDQFGCPTYATDLAVAIATLIRTESFGIYHVTNEGSCSWYEFTQQILKTAGITKVRVEPITSEELSRPAPRPKYSILNKEGLRSLNITMPIYQDALARFIEKNALTR